MDKIVPMQHVIRTSLSGRSPVGNALFPRRERSVPMLGIPPKVPLLHLETAAGTGRRRYRSKWREIARVTGKGMGTTSNYNLGSAFLFSKLTKTAHFLPQISIKTVKFRLLISPTSH